jgi:hypothetical protein
MITSSHPAEIEARNKIFSKGFQSEQDFARFLKVELGGSVAAKLKEPASNWSVTTFHALFVASWLNQPTEKGTYMIDLSHLPPEQVAEVRKAYEQNLYSRPSSHLDGGGRSGSKGFKFLKGYKELLVQMPEIETKPYLLLKAEGHSTGLSGVIPHMLAWGQKIMTGEGRLRSPELHALAHNETGLVERRAAENFSKQYASLLKQLGLSGKTVTVHEMAGKLFEKTGHVPPQVDQLDEFLKEATNAQLGTALKSFCSSLSDQHGARDAEAWITNEMLDELDKIAASLLSDPQGQRGRVFREIYAKPEDLDRTIGAFAGVNDNRLTRQIAFRESHDLRGVQPEAGPSRTG